MYSILLSATARIRILLIAGLLAIAGCAHETRLSEGTVEFLASGPSGEPNLYSAPDGNVYLTWFEQSMDEEWKLMVAVRGPHGWSTPRSIVDKRDFFVNWADFPSLLVLSDRHWLVHWLERVPGNRYAYHVRMASSDDQGRTWSDSFSPHTDQSPTEHGFLSMAQKQDGSVVAVWLDGREKTPDELESQGDMSVRATVIGESGGLAADRLIDRRTCECCNTALTIARSGPVVAYRDRSDGEVRNIAVSRLVDAGWTAPVAVHDDNWIYPACPVNGPALDSQGDTVVIAWYTAPTRTGPAVRAAFSTDGGAAFRNPVRVDEGNPIGRVDIVMVDSTSAVVTWLERENGESADIMTRFVYLDGTMGDARTLARTSAQRMSGFPRAVRREDVLYVAWTDVRENGNRVKVSSFRIAR